MLHDAAAGRFPPPDFSTTVLPSPSSSADAVLGFFAHHVIASDVAAELVGEWTARDAFALSDVRFLAALGDRIGVQPGIYDVVYAAHGEGRDAVDVELVETDDRSHPRVQRALHYRTPSTVRVFNGRDGRGMLLLGRGLAGRMEAAFEVDPADRGQGVGKRLVRAARALAPAGEPVFVQVSPANTSSMRAVADDPTWRPVGSEILYLVRPAAAG